MNNLCYICNIDYYKTKMTLKKKTFLYIFIFLLLIGVGGFFYVKKIVSTGFDIHETVYIEIDNQKDYNTVLRQVDKIAKIENIGNFERVSEALQYPDNIKSGRYAVKPDMDVLQLVRLLKSGAQTPIKLKFNNLRTKKDLTERLSQQLMLTEQELKEALDSPEVYEKYGFNDKTIIAMFIPNTYEFYWNVSLDKFLDRMNKEYKTFWTEARLKKAQDVGLSPVEVSVLASIVEEECYYTDEYPIVAGLYLNRIRKGMLLQADPTVKFAVGDFSIRRVLNRHLETDSPYNTYKYAGLPPGPIRIPSIKGIDAVLNYTPNNYIYMCAKEDLLKRHNFAVTHAEHERNRIKYQAALNKRRIYN